MRLFKKIHLIILATVAVVAVLAIAACKKAYLRAQPYGQYGQDQVKTKKALDAFLIGVYGMIDGQNITGDTWETSAVNWATAGVAADDAYKGTDANDQPQMTEVENYQSQPSNRYFLNKWLGLYEGVARANNTIRLANDPDIEGLDDASKTSIIAQARFLRGHFHFDAKRMYNKIPYITETTEQYDNKGDSWTPMEEDFRFAYDNLPETYPGDQKARVNKWAAAAYLAKVYMFQKKFTEAKALFDVIITEGKTSQGAKYGLVPAYWQIFDPTYDNNEEGVFYIASSASGTVDQAGERSLGLAFPYGGDFGCCGFFQPSQNLVNAHKVDATGLPLFDTFNDTDLKNDQGLISSQPFAPDNTTPVDPRLDWSVGRRGINYWDWGPHPGYNWIRDQNYAGPYSPKKHVFSKREANVLTSSGWKNITAKDIYIIRYADVLLLAAEAETEVGSLDKAKDYVNLVRARAGAAQSRVEGSPANYQIGQYVLFANQDYARKAVRFERRLELAQEGHRFFDLVRWGIAAQTLNAYLAVEKTKRTYKQTANFVAGKHEYFPLAQSIIDFAAKEGNLLEQNPGY